MISKQTGSIQYKSRCCSLSTYFLIAGYVLVALLIRALTLSPIIALLVTPAGWSIQWLSILCPILIITLILPMRFSFARALMASAQGGSFSIWRALRLTQYQKKLSVSLCHASWILCWSLPFLITLGFLYYVVVCMDAFSSLRMLTNLGASLASIVTSMIQLFNQLFGSSVVSWEGGFMEGIYLIAGIALFTMIILIWGIWRCSIYRYLWAAGAVNSRGTYKKMKSILHGYRWKQLVYGIYNLILWLPTLFFLFLVILSIQLKIIALVTLFLETRSLQPITLSQGETVLFAVGLLCHILILPLRRRESMHFAEYVIAKRKAQT